jgi:transposase
VTHVAFESTGVYWRPVFNILEDEERTLLLVNPQHMRWQARKRTSATANGWPTCSDTDCCGLRITANS